MSGRSKVLALLLGVLLLLTILVFYFKGTEEAVDAEAFPFNSLSREWREEGSTAGNIANAGLVGHNGDIVALSTSSGLKILNLEGEGLEIIDATVDRVWDINVTEEAIFFINLSDGSTVYRMGLDGSNVKKLNDTHSRHLYVGGGYIYFADNWARNHFYRMDVEGNNVERVMQNPAIWAVIEGDWVYYAHDMENYNLYKYNMATQEDIQLTSHNAWRIVPYKDWVYYIKGFEEGPIYRTKKDGSETGLVLDVNANMFLIRDGCIYYSEYDFDPGFYKYRLEDEGLEKISEDVPDLLYEIDKYIILINVYESEIRKFNVESRELKKLVL